jgi:general secretion pathway protein A
MILNDLEMPCDQLNRVQMIQSLHDLVLLTFQSRLPPPLIIVDEAQNLADDVLEEIRLLTNLEVGDTKLVQVILAGQPELERKLEKPNLRQLGQRIAVRARLEPLGADETAAYVRHRLKVAGAKNVDLFSNAALATVWRRTAGLPRLINILCEQSLVNAYGAARKKVDESLVDEAVSDLGLDRPGAGAPPAAVHRAPALRGRTWSSLFGLSKGEGR